MSVRILIGDCVQRMADLPDNSVDSVVCDPPYHLTAIGRTIQLKHNATSKAGTARRNNVGFMGQTWDGGDVAFQPETWAEVLRVLKPGGHLVAFSGTRTYHRMACAIEDAGFEIRDQLAWIYGSGFPKSLDVSKQIDKARRRDFVLAAIDLGVTIPGNSLHDWTKAEHAPGDAWWEKFKAAIPAEQWAAIERKVEGRNERKAGWFTTKDGHDITAPATEAAQQWQGWGTALKPGWEPICLARKPLDGTVANNVLTHGTGALNIDGCRIEAQGRPLIESKAEASVSTFGDGLNGSRHAGQTDLGRWPANLCHDGSDEVLAGFPESDSGAAAVSTHSASMGYGGSKVAFDTVRAHGDSGSAARFFYCAKATTEERGEGNNHPTVKPVALMRWLCRLITPKGGTVLDPFMGSGSTALACDAEQFNFIGCELSADYAAIAERRVREAAGLFAEVKAA